MKNRLGKFLSIIFMASLYWLLERTGVLSLIQKIPITASQFRLMILIPTASFVAYWIYKATPKSTTSYDIEYHTREIIITSKSNKISFGIQKQAFTELLTWEEANTKCINLGADCRLPTFLELNLIYLKHKAINGFSIGNYWTSTLIDSGEVWTINFETGEQLLQNINSKLLSRAVRTINYTA